MISSTDPTKHFDSVGFAQRLTQAMTVAGLQNILTELPIVDENEYVFNPSAPSDGWKHGFLHWYPVGGDRGNAGRIKLAGSPENPIAERTINAMESMIELHRQLEIRKANSDPPTSPRAAIKRYFDLPQLSELPRRQQPIRGIRPREYARNVAKNIRVRLVRQARPVEYALVIEDDGIGQSPDHLNSTLLSLGQSDKADKPYLIGVFGQGGSSAFAACDLSWVISRRHPELLATSKDGVGWTAVKHVFPKGRRDTYFAYLAAHPDGRVPSLPASVGGAINLSHGSRFAHLRYDFGNTEPARRLYATLNHLLFDPVLPYELYTGPGRPPDPMYGNGYRLTLRAVQDKDKRVLDKNFGPQMIFTSR
ncbi:MAG TPA: hypothetical protein VJY15_23065 [Candidatus Acidoferrum sp.]|nr:hypothetical protein [Candidatus Acidoferrum sp.]